MWARDYAWGCICTTPQGSEVLEALQRSLAGRYELERKIGEGGMATVYLARDVRHRRPVAVKVLKDDLSATLGSDRFLREIEIAAGLTHPHILALHDSGEVAGQLYYVMPFIAGESLRDRLDRERTLPVPAALAITSEVADALTYAHREGVIHRDIKPENVLFSEGHAVVADFGIAKAISTAGGSNLTVTGYPVGTPGYMSPEQAAGITELDERTDVYGLACVVYEMLVGEVPRVWTGDDAVHLGRFVNAEPEHRERLDRLPGRLEQVLVQALAVAPDARHATPLEFADALGRAAEGSPTLGDAEVGKILERAAALQAAQPTVDGGLTRAIVEQVAVEAGIVRACIEQALEKVERDSSFGPAFSDAEVRGILGHAVKLEETYWKDQDGLSLAGVERVGAEVGISPERVRRAAGELELESGAEGFQPSPPKAGLFQRARKLEIDRVVNEDMSRLDYSHLIGILLGTGVIAHVNTLGRTLECSVAFPGNVGRDVRATMKPQGSRTQIHVEERLSLVGGMMLAPFFGAAGGAAVGALLTVSTGNLVGPILVIPATIGAVVGANLTARAVLAAAAKRRARQLSALAGRLTSLLKQMARQEPARGERR